MKKYFLLLMLSGYFGFSQMTFTPGMQWEGGLSTIRLTGEPVKAPDGSDFELKPGFCFGLAFCGDLNLKNGRSGFGASLGVQQFRSLFKNYADVTPPRYELNYYDLNIRMFLKGPNSEARTKWFISYGVTGSYMFSAWRVYNTGSDLISDNFNAVDFGFQLEVGVEHQLKRNDFIRATINSYLGLRQIFTGSGHINNLTGRNGNSQLSLYYILGKRKQE